MKIKVWSRKPRQAEVDVTFPLYSKWVGDTYTTVNRVDENGRALSITKSVGETYGYEFVQSVVKFDPMDASYLPEDCTEADFFGMLDEMITAAKAARGDILR